VTDSVLHKYGVVVRPGFVPAEITTETTFGVTIQSLIPQIFINLKMCLTDETVIATVAHEMAHALDKLQHGYSSHHTPRLFGSGVSVRRGSGATAHRITHRTSLGEHGNYSPIIRFKWWY
jgi:hypothetical protein